MHHYNFPPYSVGEAKGAARSPGRRNRPWCIGCYIDSCTSKHWGLPVCNSCGIRSIILKRSIMDPLRKHTVPHGCRRSYQGSFPVLQWDWIGELSRMDCWRFAILSGHSGMEDFLGDMDFKVAGTPVLNHGDSDGHQSSRIVQTDPQGRAGTGSWRQNAHHEQMLDEIKEPREEMSPYAPRIISMQIDPDKIRNLIGLVERPSTESSLRSKC